MIGIVTISDVSKFLLCTKKRCDAARRAASATEVPGVPWDASTRMPMKSLVSYLSKLPVRVLSAQLFETCHPYVAVGISGYPRVTVSSGWRYHLVFVSCFVFFLLSAQSCLLESTILFIWIINFLSFFFHNHFVHWLIFSYLISWFTQKKIFKPMNTLHFILF